MKWPVIIWSPTIHELLVPTVRWSLWSPSGCFGWNHQAVSSQNRSQRGDPIPNSTEKQWHKIVPGGEPTADGAHIDRCMESLNACFLVHYTNSKHMEHIDLATQWHLACICWVSSATNIGTLRFSRDQHFGVILVATVTPDCWSLSWMPSSRWNGAEIWFSIRFCDHADCLPEASTTRGKLAYPYISSTQNPPWCISSNGINPWFAR